MIYRMLTFFISTFGQLFMQYTPMYGAQGSIPGGVKDINFYPGAGYVSIVCALFCAVSVGGPSCVLI